MKNSIEEDMKILEEMIENANIENMDMNDCFGGEHIEAIEHILSDYKRVLEINKVLLKENEILKEEKEQAWEEWNNLEQGSYEIEQKLKQQIKKLQKENEELKFEERSRIIGKYGDTEIHDVINRTLSNDYIPVQKVKDKIEYLDKQQKQRLEDRELKASDSEIIFARDVLRELLEGRK